MHELIQRLQYITHGTPAEQVQQTLEACQTGVRWIQLRLKNTEHALALETALHVKDICQTYDAVFIVNDHVQIALAADADGVHLGKEDASPLEARRLLGAGKIIGGTANTWQDIEKLLQAQVDYIGLGPYRFTSTKEKLSPVLGLEGYGKLMQRMQEQQRQVPVIAIGGLTEVDLPALLPTGVYGVAVSSAITQAEHKAQTVQSFQSLLSLHSHGTIDHSR